MGKIQVQWRKEKRQGTNRLIYPITIQIEGLEIDVLGIVDSGNLLKSGTEKKPVIVIEKSCLRNICLQQKPFVIPYVTLGNPRGKLLGIIGERMVIHEKGSIYEYQNVSIGIYDGTLAKGVYQVILPSLSQLERYRKKQGLQWNQIMKKICYRKNRRVKKCVLQQ